MAVKAATRLPMFSSVMLMPVDVYHILFQKTKSTSLISTEMPLLSLTTAWFGQRLLDKLGVKAAFPLGFGLSYTSFKLSDASVSCGKADTLDIHVSVCNSGLSYREIRRTNLWHAGPSCGRFPTRLLLGFAAVELGAGESKLMSMEASICP